MTAQLAASLRRTDGGVTPAGADIRMIYRFGKAVSEGHGSQKSLLGGKGANLAEMSAIGLPVPPGFTITTEASVEYYGRKKAFPPGMWDQALQGLKKVERAMHARFGDPANPLLVSVRSGA